MPKKISTTLLFTVAVAIVALFAATEVGAQLTPSTEVNSGDECPPARTDYKDWQCGPFTVNIEEPFPSYDSATDRSTYSWTISTTDSSQFEISHFNILIPFDMVEKVVTCTGSGNGSCEFIPICDGGGDVSTRSDGRFGKYLTWNCTGKFEWEHEVPIEASKTVSLTFEGRSGTDVTDSFVKSGSTGENWKWGPILGPALPRAETPIIASTKISFTAEDLLGNRYLIEIQKNQAGDILEIWRTNLQTNVSENITNAGISWDQIQINVQLQGWESLVFITNDTASKTGDTSTCGYWYRGVFWNFCPPPP